MKPFQHIAFCLENNSVSAVEIEINKTTQILTYGDYKSQVNFDDLDSLPSKKNIIIPEFKNFLNSIKSVSPNISFALNSRSVFLSTIPVDANLKETELKSVIEWEFNKYFSNSNPNDYLISSHKLPSQIKSPFYNYLIVGIRNTLISLLEEVAKSLNKKLNIIELDHFGAEHLLNSVNNKIKSQRVVLIGADENSYDLSILSNGQSEQFANFTSDDDKSFDRITKLLLEQRVTQIFVYGRFTESIISSPLTKLISIPISYLNPFEFLEFSKSKKIGNDSKQFLSRFSASAGLALRIE